MLCFPWRGFFAFFENLNEITRFREQNEELGWATKKENLTKLNITSVEQHVITNVVVQVLMHLA